MTWMKRTGWLAAAALTLANPLLHKPVSDVCDWASAAWGFKVYDRVALVSIPLVTLAIALAFALARGRSLRFSRASLIAVLVLAVLSVAAQRWLLVANIELIHFPQYALLAGVLLVCGLSAPAAFLGSTAAGVLDEWYQHLVVYAGRADTYFDINDIVLNAIGAAWGVVLLADLLSRPNTVEPSASWTGVERRQTLTRGAAVSLIALPLTIWLDPPHFVPMFRPLTTAHAMFRVLSTAEGLVVVTLLWGVMVLVADRRHNKGTVPGRVSGSLAVWLCIALIVCASACASTPVRAASSPQTPTASASQGTSDSFITTFWCGPPLDQFDAARAEEIVAAGFTIVGPPCERRTGPFRPREALDVAARHGLKLWIADARFDEHAPTRPNWQDQVAAAVADYKDHPGFGGYFLTDEPAAQKFADLAAVATRIRELDPNAFIYTNLLADYFPMGWGTATYRDYVEQFVAAVRPSILSYDYYPFLEQGDRQTFFSNLTMIREVALEHHVPFMLIILAMPHGPYRDPNEAEMSWQALQALAFGARGLSYFAYWTPVDVGYADTMKFRRGLIEHGKPTPHYEQATRINRLAIALARELRSFHSIAVTDSNADAAEGLPIGPIAAIEGGNITVGLFEDAGGARAVLLVNRDYRRPVAVRLRLLQNQAIPERFDTETGGWTRDEDGTIRLTKGGAALLRWTGRH